MDMNQRVNKTAITALVIIFIMCGQCIAKQDSSRHIDSSDMLIESMADMESKDDRDALSLWADSEMIKALSETAITDDYIKSLYSEFISVMVTPPNPDTYKEYGIENAEEALKRVSQLGRRIHNLGLAMSDAAFKKYGGLIKCMRDALYVDSKYIPLAIKHDNSRDVYWYDLHNKLIKEADNRYKDLF